MATPSLPVRPPAVVKVPVKIMVGDTELDLGTMHVETRAAASSARAALGNLLDSAAHIVRRNPDGWPRQLWWVGENVPLPGSLARGTVVQIDQRAKRYLVDTGKTKPVPVLWSEVDPLASHCALTLDAVIDAVESYGRTGTRR